MAVRVLLPQSGGEFGDCWGVPADGNAVAAGVAAFEGVVVAEVGAAAAAVVVADDDGGVAAAAAVVDDDDFEHEEQHVWAEAFSFYHPDNHACV